MRATLIILALVVMVLSACSAPQDATAPTPAELTARTGDTVAVDYVGMLTNGSVFDSSEGREPLSFQIGAGQLIPGFEQGVIGMAVNETKQITIPAEQAYGLRNESRVVEQTVPVEGFGLPEENVTALVGQTIPVTEPQTGGVLPAQVLSVENGNVTLLVDYNPPLAGETLVFDVTMRDIERTSVD